MTGKSTPRIREFRRADVLPLKALIHRTIGTCYPGHYCAEAVRFFLGYHDERAILRDAREGCTIILDKAGRIIGTGSLVAGEIKRVFVDPGAQKQGFGRLIMQSLEEKAVSAGLMRVRLDASLPSKAFYDRLGYATVEKAFREVENGRRLDFFKMEKMLCVSTRPTR
jgi:GNAT superfamily N-acetyltransferase